MKVLHDYFTFPSRKMKCWISLIFVYSIYVYAFFDEHFNNFHKSYEKRTVNLLKYVSWLIQMQFFCWFFCYTPKVSNIDMSSKNFRMQKNHFFSLFFHHLQWKNTRRFEKIDLSIIWNVWSPKLIEMGLDPIIIGWHMKFRVIRGKKWANKANQML